ncbi:MAG: type II secretion system minor pseudopilin GspJ, partial [Proteobacteria bacterium]|nr:type II secretion system minor pseudopilin GspJ [Pseudomonadota bacterium]
ELMVAVALLAVITSMAYRGLDSMTRSSAHSLAVGEHWQGVALLFERIASDVAQPSRRPVRALADKDPALPEWWGRPLDNTAADIDPAAAQLEFTRKSPPGRDEVRLGYRLHANKVELLLWPALDRAPGSLPEIYVLLEGVSTLNFRYLDSGGTWQDNWPIVGSKETLPRAIAVEITLNDGTNLHRLFALPS